MREQRTSEIQWSRLNRAIADWVVGYGFLSVHIGLYLLAAVALVLINLYRSPDRFHVQGALFIWGIILLLHGGFVVVRTALARATKQLNEDRRPGSAATMHEAGSDAAGARPTGRFGAKSDGLSLERAQRFVQERVVQPVAARATPSTTNRPDEPPATAPDQATSDHARETWPHANGNQSPASVTQRGLALLNSSASHAKDLAERAQVSARDVFHRALGESEPVAPGRPPPAPKSPSPSWPTTPNAHRTESSPLANPVTPVAAVPPNGTPLAGGSVVFPPYMGGKLDNGKVMEPLTANGSKQVVPPIGPVPSESPAKTDPKTEWTWMEAAAAAWLAQREVDEPKNGDKLPKNEPPPHSAEQVPPTNET